MRLQNKVALITGAAQGIGEAIAKAFLHEGATVVLSDIQHDKGSLAVSKMQGPCEYLDLDVRNEAAWQVVTQKIVDTYGRLDVVVNNAGITGLDTAGSNHDPEHGDLDSWKRVHDTNLNGTFLGCKYAIRAMKKTGGGGGGGSIINISSRSGVVGVSGAVAYASSKAAIRNHTKSVALYCAEQNLNIRCNSIHPAAILTPMWDDILGHGPEREENMRIMTLDTPLKRFGLPEEVASLAVMLASDESSYITGSEFHIDGGILAGSAASPAAEN